MSGFGSDPYGGFTYGGSETGDASTPTTSGGGFRTQTMQDLLGSILQSLANNSLTATTAAQTAVLNRLVAWGDTLAMDDATTATNGALTAWCNWTYGNAVYR